MATRRRTVFYLVLMAGIVVCVTVCIVLTAIKEGRPRINIANEVIDFGIIDGREPNTPKRVVFRIQDRGSGVLKLTRIYARCPCLEPRLDKDILSPGEMARPSVSVSVPSTIGQFRERISLFSNDQSNPVKHLVVKGFVHRDCYVLPESVVVNGLRLGEKRRIELDATGPVGDKSFAICEVSADDDKIRLCKVEKIGSMVESSRPVWQIVLTVTGRGRDAWEGTILVSTSSQNSALLEVPVNVSELPPVRADPPVVIFRCGPDNKAPTAQVALAANTPTPVAIVGIEKPNWVDLHVEPGVNSLPARLHLTMREVPDRIRFGTQDGVVLKLRDGLTKVRIPILILSTPAEPLSQRQGKPNEG
jgi:hypothetical protein